jgi:HlyD family secretion protein
MKALFKKWLIRALLVIVVGLVLIALLRPNPVAVEVAVLQRGPLTVTVDDQGRTRAKDPFIVASPIYGRHLRSQLNEGDEVITGEVVARIALPQEDLRTEAVLVANLEAAEARYEMVIAEIMEAEAAFNRALREEERRQQLAEDGLISTEERENYRQFSIAAETRLMSLDASRIAVAAEVESARSRMLGVGDDDQVVIHNVLSPTDGTVIRLLEENERVLAAGTPLLAISNEDELEIVVDLLTQDAVKVEAGDQMLITGWGGDRILQAEVQYIEPEAFTKFSALGVEEQRVNVIAEFTEDADMLGAGYRIEASVIIWQAEDVLLIPTSAIFQRNNAWYTYVVENSQASLRQFTIGNRNQEFAEVTGMLEPGETVILFPSDLIEQGVSVSF